MSNIQAVSRCKVNKNGSHATNGIAKDILLYIKQLNDSDPLERYGAVFELGKKGSKAQGAVT